MPITTSFQISLKMAPQVLVGVAMLAFALSQASAFDPSPLQDFCVPDRNSAVCKDPKLAVPEDFFLPGLDKPGNTDNAVGSNVTLVNAAALPGLNTLGISIACIDYAPSSLNPPHTHPRPTEILTVLEGILYVGFVTSNSNNLFAKILHKGDVFVFPICLIRFHFNVGDEPAVAIAGLNSQNPGVITIANAVFGSNPKIAVDVLGKAFQVNKQMIEELMVQFK